MTSRLTLGYSSLVDRVRNIKSPTCREDWDLVVVAQDPESIHAADDVVEVLSDVKLTQFDLLQSKGVAKSRNRVMEISKSEYLAFADDDVEFIADGLNQALDYLEKNAEVGLLLLQAQDPSGALRKSYPKSPNKLNLFNSARAATYEMVVRLAEIKRLGVRFDENFGAGATNYLGDEYIFIADYLRNGGKAMFLPITVAIHPIESSGSRWGTDEDRRARAAIFSRVFGRLAWAVRLAFGLRRYSEFHSFSSYIKFVVGR